MVLGSEEALAISHAQKLLVLIYFSGPSLVKDHLLQSPVCAVLHLNFIYLLLDLGIMPCSKNNMLLKWSRIIHDNFAESFSSIIKFIENN